MKIAILISQEDKRVILIIQATELGAVQMQQRSRRLFKK
jgi:hypothetical protein